MKRGRMKLKKGRKKKNNAFIDFKEIYRHSKIFKMRNVSYYNIRNNCFVLF